MSHPLFFFPPAGLHPPFGAKPKVGASFIRGIPYFFQVSIRSHQDNPDISKA
jgi:hypothetical protein